MHEIFTTMLSGLDELSIYTTKPMTRDDTPDMPDAIRPLYLLIKIDVDAEKYTTPHKAYVYGEHFCRARDYELVDYHYPMKCSERHYPYIAQ